MLLLFIFCVYSMHEVWHWECVRASDATYVFTIQQRQ